MISRDQAPNAACGVRSTCQGCPAAVEPAGRGLSGARFVGWSAAAFFAPLAASIAAAMAWRGHRVLQSGAAVAALAGTGVLVHLLYRRSRAGRASPP